MVVEPENVQAHPQRTHAQWLLTNRMMMRMREIPGISFHPPFTPACPPGIQFEQPLLRGRMHTAIVFFTEELVNDIVKHTNSYAVHRSGIQQHIKDKQINRGIKLWVLADSKYVQHISDLLFSNQFLWRCCPYNKEPFKLVFASILSIIWVSLNSQFKFC